MSTTTAEDVESQPPSPEADKAPGEKTPANGYEDIFDPVEHPNEVVMAVGGEGAGKTHFAATAPSPLHVIGTEAGHEAVTLAKSFPDKDIGHLSLTPSMEGDVKDIWFGSWFGVAEQLQKAIDVLDDAPPGTVIIDSASDLLGIAAARFNKQLQRADDPIPPMMYGQLYPVLDGWIGRLRQNHNVVLCTRTKDEWGEDDERTGDEVADIWKTGPYLAEHVVWIMRAPIGDKRVGAVTKGLNDGRLLYDPTFEAVTSEQPIEHDARPMRKALKSLKQAYDYCESQSVHVDRIVPDTLEGVDERINDLRNQLNGMGDGDE